MKQFFTSDFFKFLLGFSLIILASFAALIFFGSRPELNASPEAAAHGEADL